MCSALFNRFEGNVNLLWNSVDNYYKFRPFRWKKFQQNTVILQLKMVLTNVCPWRHSKTVLICFEKEQRYVKERNKKIRNI